MVQNAFQHSVSTHFISCNLQLAVDECFLLISIAKILYYGKLNDTKHTVYTRKLSSVTDYSGENMRLVSMKIQWLLTSHNVQEIT